MLKLITYDSQFNKAEDIGKLLTQWVNNNNGKHIVHYKKQIEELMDEVGYDISKINKEVFEKIRKRNNWVERFKWPITAWNSFCKYGIIKRPDLFLEDYMIKRVHALPQSTLPKTIDEEVHKILDGHLVFATSEKMKEGSQRGMISSVKAFYGYVISQEPGRIVVHLSDFTEQDAQSFKNNVIETQVSPITGQKVSFNTLSKQIADIKRVYKMGVEQKKLLVDITRDIKLRYRKTTKREFCLSKEQIEKLRRIDGNKLKEMSIEERFKYVRDATMVSVQYEPALRAEECVNLCWEALPKYERSNTNVGPVVVIGAKARPENHEDRVYILCDRLDSDLARWKVVSEAYCQYKKISPPEIVINGKVYHPIFFSAKGKTIKAETYISSIFTNKAEKTGIILPAGYKSHIVRHARITHWIDEGYPFEKVHENARHSDLSMTWRYFHSNAQKRIEAVEKVEKLDKESRNIRMTVLPPKGVLRSIIQNIFYYIKKNTNVIEAEELEPVNIFEMEKGLRESCVDYIESKAFYTARDMVDKWGLGRTQTFQRLKTLTKDGLIKPVLDKNGKKKYLKEEIDYLTSLVDSKKASIAFGYKEKVPTTIPGLANKGIIRSTKIGKLHHFQPQELIEHFYDKHFNHTNTSQN